MRISFLKILRLSFLTTLLIPPYSPVCFICSLQGDDIMSIHQDYYPLPDDLQPVAPLRRRRPSRPFWSIFSTLMLGLVVLTGLMGNGPLPTSKSFTATLQKPVKGVTTYQQFMKLARSTPTHKTLTRQLTAPTSKASLASTKAVKKSTARVLPVWNLQK